MRAPTAWCFYARHDFRLLHVLRPMQATKSHSGAPSPVTPTAPAAAILAETLDIDTHAVARHTGDGAATPPGSTPPQTPCSTGRDLGLLQGERDIGSYLGIELAAKYRKTPDWRLYEWQVRAPTYEG